LRDYDTAEAKYLALTGLEPDNPDGYGELGNMYFSQGKWDQAATAYYQAGVRLVGQGLLTQAEELLAVIRGLNGANADELEQKITDARNAANQ
jgi:tetratricopeptide (TPR) repeat protein